MGGGGGWGGGEEKADASDKPTLESSLFYFECGLYL